MQYWRVKRFLRGGGNWVFLREELDFETRRLGFVIRAYFVLYFSVLVAEKVVS
jgi:hypothetical protein